MVRVTQRCEEVEGLGKMERGGSILSKLVVGFDCELRGMESSTVAGNSEARLGQTCATWGLWTALAIPVCKLKHLFKLL